MKQSRTKFSVQLCSAVPPIILSHFTMKAQSFFFFLVKIVFIKSFLVCSNHKARFIRVRPEHIQQQRDQIRRQNPLDLWRESKGEYCGGRSIVALIWKTVDCSDTQQSSRCSQRSTLETRATGVILGSQLVCVRSTYKKTQLFYWLIPKCCQPIKNGPAPPFHRNWDCT